MKAKLRPEEFVKLAIAKLRLENYKGIHSIYSGFNEAFKSYFVGANLIDATGEPPSSERSSPAGQGGHAYRRATTGDEPRHMASRRWTAREA
jgi:hypothetical protein